MLDVSQDVPERLGRYEIVERIASGGMGEVFIARYVAPGGFMKPVAVKRIHPYLTEDETFIHMLHDEANVAAAIRHPNIIATIDVGFEAGNHFVVLDYANGDPLQRMQRDLKRKNATFPDWMVAWIGAEVASALHAAHEAKNLSGESLEIIHRDVSLSNVILSDAGHPLLFDFGVAKAKQRLVKTSHGELKGKLPYMAPETFRGEAVDRTVDIFSLGVMLYELCTGTAPFARDSDLETIMALQSAVVPPPSEVNGGVHASIDPIVMRTMARERAARYPTAQAVENDLRAWARERGAPHDASSAAAWIAENFAPRCEARKALLARVASSAPISRASFTSAPRIGTLTPGQAISPEALAAGAAGAEASQRIPTLTPGSAVQMFAPNTPIPGSFSPTPIEPSASSISIPGVAQGEMHEPLLAPSPPAARSGLSMAHVFLGVFATLLLGGGALVILAARASDATDTTAAAQPNVASPVPAPTESAAPPAQAASAAPVAAPTPSASASAATGPVAAPAASPTSDKPAAPPTPTTPTYRAPTTYTPPTKKGGLVRSYD